MARVINDFFPKSELEIEPFDQLSDISDSFQQTLARLLAYNEAAGLFKLLRVDSEGRLYVTTQSISAANGAVAIVTVSNVAVLIRAANANRREITIYNGGSDTLFIGFDNGVSPINGFELQSGSYWSTDIYTGDVYGRYSTVINQRVSVMEFD